MSETQPEGVPIGARFANSLHALQNSSSKLVAFLNRNLRENKKAFKRQRAETEILRQDLFKLQKEFYKVAADNAEFKKAFSTFSRMSEALKDLDE
tara:strand:+ start:432 stop:716 length:285 start_codon:yes stop_codon:yes gene_type:complete